MWFIVHFASESSWERCWYHIFWWFQVDILQFPWIFCQCCNLSLLLPIPIKFCLILGFELCNHCTSDRVPQTKWGPVSFWVCASIFSGACSFHLCHRILGLRMNLTRLTLGCWLYYLLHFWKCTKNIFDKMVLSGIEPELNTKSIEWLK